MEQSGAGLGEAGGTPARSVPAAVGGAETPGGGAGGPAAPVDFREAAEKETVSIDSREDTIMLARRSWQGRGRKHVTLAPRPPLELGKIENRPKIRASF